MTNQDGIRLGGAEDAETIVAFNVAMAAETEDQVLDPEIVRRGVEGLLARPERGFYVVAERGGRPVASLMVTSEWSDWRAGLFWWIQSVYVEEAARRQGLFRALYEWVRHRAQGDDEVCGLRLYVERENRIAQDTYTAVGMHETVYRLWEEPFDPSGA